jgi:hypothetical protein
MSSDDRDPVITRDHVIETLRHAGVDTDTIDAVLRDLALPARISKVLQHTAHFGITRDTLIDRMGGSP